jgi:hypothetical protein
MASRQDEVDQRLFAVGVEMSEKSSISVVGQQQTSAVQAILGKGGSLGSLKDLSSLDIEHEIKQMRLNSVVPFN